MKLIHFKDGTCRKVQAHFDAYMDNELLVETSREVMEHLKSCPACSSTLDDRIRFRGILRRAGFRVAVPILARSLIRAWLALPFSAAAVTRAFSTVRPSSRTAAPSKRLALALG